MRRQLALTARVASLLGTDEIELVALNGAPPLSPSASSVTENALPSGVRRKESDSKPTL
jgi:hypothetical protein